MYDPLKAKTKAALAVAACFLAGLALASQFGFVDTAVEMPAVQTAPAVEDEAVRPALDLSEAFVNVAEAVTPSVVRIETTRRLVREQDPRDWLYRRQQPQTELPEIQPLSGSGFIISEDGYVITNNHVIEDVERISVTLPDGREFGARVVGADPTTDVAVIRIDGEGLPTVSLGSSAEVEVGQWVLAIGNPGFTRSATRLDYTVTAGIVSAVGRSLELIDQSLRQNPAFQQVNPSYAIENFIQTDAVINSGNSGGPMVNLRGQVIGINSALVSQTGVYQGYGFAIPIDLAREVMEDLITYGRVRRALLGVRVQSVESADAEALGLPDVSGVLVQSVTDGAPAARAGIRMGDVITALDGEKVGAGPDLQHMIALKAPGDRALVTIYRDGAPLDLTVRLEELEYATQVAVAAPPSTAAGDKIGAVVTGITPEIADQLRLESTAGVVIAEVQSGGPAHRKGLGPPCVIQEIDGRAIANESDYRDAFRTVDAGEVVSMIVACPEYRLGWTPAMYNIRVPR